MVFYRARVYMRAELRYMEIATAGSGTASGVLATFVVLVLTSGLFVGLVNAKQREKGGVPVLETLAQ